MRHWKEISILFLVALLGCARTEKTEPGEGTETPAGEAPAGTPMTATAPPATPVGSSSALDGKAYEVQVADPSGTKLSDKLTFADGTFESSECTKYNFAKSGYQVQESGGATMVTAVAKSPTDGTMEWSGTIRESQIEGTARWTNLEGKITMYTFNGSMAGASMH